MLSTKTLDPETLAYAQSLNLNVQCTDFIETSPVSFEIKDIDTGNFDAVVFTSANAVKYFFENKDAWNLLRSKLVFALEGKTNDALLVYEVIASGKAASANELADVMAAEAVQSVLHICGNLRLETLEDKLKQAGIGYKDLAVYRTGILTDKKITEHFDAVLFFSPSGVDGFFSLNHVTDKTVCCCIGETTAQALRGKNKTANIIIPQQPSPVAMLAAVANYWK